MTKQPSPNCRGQHCSPVQFGNIIPIGDRVLLKPHAERQSDTGIYIPADSRDKSQLMHVIAAPTTGDLKPNDLVLVAKYAGVELNHNDERYTVVHTHDILAKVKEKN